MLQLWVGLKDPMGGSDKLVLRDSRKRFACPTKEEALESLKHRSKHRLSHLNAALQKAKAIDKAIADTATCKIENLIGGSYAL